MGKTIKTFKPGQVTEKLGIPSRRLIHWREKGYAPADGPPTPGGGAATYTVAGALACGLLDRFLEREKLATKAAIMTKDKVLEHLPKLLLLRQERGHDHWLITSSIAAIGIFPAGLETSKLIEAGIVDPDQQIQLVPVEGVLLYVPKVFSEYFGDRTSISFYNLTAIVLGIAERLGVEL